MVAGLVPQTKIAGDVGVAQTLVSRWLSGNVHVNYERMDKLMADWLRTHSEEQHPKRKCPGITKGGLAGRNRSGGSRSGERPTTIVGDNVQRATELPMTQARGSFGGLGIPPVMLGEWAELLTQEGYVYYHDQLTNETQVSLLHSCCHHMQASARKIVPTGVLQLPFPRNDV